MYLNDTLNAGRDMCSCKALPLSGEMGAHHLRPTVKNLRRSLRATSKGLTLAR
jgi:hypothetical protein